MRGRVYAEREILRNLAKRDDELRGLDSRKYTISHDNDDGDEARRPYLCLP